MPRVVVYGFDVTEDRLPKTAIRPYPTQYITQWKLDDEHSVLIRPIKPEDEPMMVQFHQSLSMRSVNARYFKPLNLGERITHERLMRICFNDYDREIALTRGRGTAVGAGEEIIGVARFQKFTKLRMANCWW